MTSDAHAGLVEATAARALAPTIRSSSQDPRRWRKMQPDDKALRGVSAAAPHGPGATRQGEYDPTLTKVGWSPLTWLSAANLIM